MSRLSPTPWRKPWPSSFPPLLLSLPMKGPAWPSLRSQTVLPTYALDSSLQPSPMLSPFLFLFLLLPTSLKSNGFWQQQPKTQFQKTTPTARFILFPHHPCILEHSKIPSASTTQLFFFSLKKKNTKEKRRNLLVELGQSQKKKIPSPHFTLLKKNSGKERGDIKRQ